jgi:lysophospholipase L1-like esterase
MTFSRTAAGSSHLGRLFALARMALTGAPVGFRRCCPWVLLIAAFVASGWTIARSAPRRRANQEPEHWIGTWAAASQAFDSAGAPTFHNQTLRLIVHTSAGGSKVRVRISNLFGHAPLVIGGARIARRAAGADIDPNSGRTLTFQQRPSIAVPANSMALSDPVELEVPALSDLAISLYVPDSTKVETLHILALQTNYVSPENGDSTAAIHFQVDKTIDYWPFLAGVDVVASPRSAAIVALGSSLTDGDGSTKDANRRWPDVLAERLHTAGEGKAQLGVLNAGIIGNRLLSDSSTPGQAGGPPPLGAVFQELGPALGQSGLARFERDVLAQAGVKYVVVALGVNDVLFPDSFVPANLSVNSQSVISGYRRLIARAHQKGIRAIGTTIPPFEHAIFRNPFFDRFYSPEKERVRQEINTWIRSSGEFDAVIDFDQAVRDPNRPTQLLPSYDSGDHLHVNDAGNVAQVNAIPLALFDSR